MKHVLRAIVGISLACTALVCRADGFVNAFEIQPGVSMNVIASQLTHEILNRTVHHWDMHEAEQKAKKAREQSAALASSNNGNVARALARNLPGKQARSAEAAYQQALHYHELVIKQFGLPSGDLGVAIASSIAGAWMAYNNKPFPDQYYVPLVRQMQQKVRSTPALQALTRDERAVAYQGLAIAGMMMASSQLSLERNPGAPGAAELEQRMRSEGGAMLTRMLDLPPERVGIGAGGFIVLASAAR